MAIDTLAYTKRLQNAGIDRDQAEAHAEAVAHHVIPELSTKQDLEAAVSRIENRIDSGIASVKNELTLRAIGIAALSASVLFFLIKMAS